MGKQGNFRGKKAPKKENENKQDSKVSSQTSESKKSWCCGGGCLCFIVLLSALLGGIGALYSNQEYCTQLDKVLRQYAGNEMVDEGYHKAKDAWKFVKPYAEIVQEKGTELFHKAKESSEIVLEKGTELFYKAKEGL